MTIGEQGSVGPAGELIPPPIDPTYLTDRALVTNEVLSMGTEVAPGPIRRPTGIVVPAQRIFCAGMTGVQKGAFLNAAVSRHLEVARPPNELVAQFGTGNLMHRDRSIRPGRILAAEEKRLWALRRWAEESILLARTERELAAARKVIDRLLQKIARLEGRTPDQGELFEDDVELAECVHELVTGHAHFRWKMGGHRRPAFSLEFLRNFKPAKLLTVLRPIQEILEVWDGEHHEKMPLMDLLFWREMEVTLMNLAAEDLHVPHYLVSRGRNGKNARCVEMARRLCFEPWMYSVYPSYSITQTHDDEEITAQIRRFLAFVASLFISFDPLDTEEWVDLFVPAKAALAENREFIDVAANGRVMRLSTDEVMRAVRYVNQQINTRDYGLAEQIDLFIGFLAVRKVGDKRVLVISSGNELERYFAHEAGVPTITIIPEGFNASPFQEATTTIFINTMEQIPDAVRELVRRGILPDRLSQYRQIA